jgi:ribokinase
MTDPEIFVVGSFVVGLTIRVPRMPVMGEGLLGDAFDMGIGGKGTNQALAARRLGARVHLLACVGEDEFSGMAFKCFEQEGISSRYIHRVPNVNTGVGMVGILPSGENWIIGHLGANLNLRPELVDLAEETIAQCNIVMTQFEVPVETAARAMELGRKHGAITLLNPAPGKRVDKELLKNVDVLTPNESETRILQGLAPDDPTPTPELAQRLLAFGVKNIVVTRGRHGSLVVTPQGSREIPPVKVKPVDVTGAGDCFNAALAVGLGRGLNLDEAVQNANFAGAYATRFLGVINGLPTQAELEAFKESTK